MKKISITAIAILFSIASYAQNLNDKPFSAFREAGGLIFLSGQVGVPAPSFDQEVNQVFEKINTILISAGSSMDKIITVTVYLKDFGQYAKFNTLYKNYFKPPFPSRTCIGIAHLPQKASVEITVTARK
ncbi:RidA family protein [Pedobacter petrophilus]|uniref:RidA family protein n=2 Tax=Pedobacter TaxID=84567 RepID=A0A7K0G4E1_9SPHI|nr:RidA family protein [Pedobacter petrophilus]MRX78320.1 RidA family protein [Pedobacter petrophilus]